MLCIFAVGVTGQVYSFESNPCHMCAAIHNYNQWRANWEFSHSSVWPDNVTFIEGDVSSVGDHVTTPVDAVSLSLILYISH